MGLPAITGRGNLPIGRVITLIMKALVEVVDPSSARLVLGSKLKEGMYFNIVSKGYMFTGTMLYRKAYREATRTNIS